MDFVEISMSILRDQKNYHIVCTLILMKIFSFSGPLKRFKPQLIMMDWQHEILQ